MNRATLKNPSTTSAHSAAEPRLVEQNEDGAFDIYTPRDETEPTAGDMDLYTPDSEGARL